MLFISLSSVSAISNLNSNDVFGADSSLDNDLKVDLVADDSFESALDENLENGFDGNLKRNSVDNSELELSEEPISLNESPDLASDDYLFSFKASDEDILSFNASEVVDNWTDENGDIIIPQAKAVVTVCSVSQISTGDGEVQFCLKDIYNNPISNASLVYTINGSNPIEIMSDENGSILLGKFEGTNIIELKYLGDATYQNSSTFINFISSWKSKKTSSFKFSNMTTYLVLNNQRNGDYFTAILRDVEGNPLANKSVQIGFNGKIYNRTSNKTGGVKLQVNLAYPGTYTFSLSFLGDDDYNGSFAVARITVLIRNTTLTTTSYTYKYLSSSLSLKATLKLSNGTAIANKKISFLFNGKTYTAITSSNGIATVSVPITDKKDYSFTVSFAGDRQLAKSSGSGKLGVNLKILTYKWGSKGDIKKNTVLYGALVKSDLTTAILNAAKQGTPCVVFGNGSGPVYFISAGVHGHELSSQAAAIKLVNVLAKQTTFNGTIYVIPFLAPSSTQNNIRYYKNVNLNSVANKEGSLSYKLVSLAKSKNAVALGDFHCTRPGGDPGKNVAMGTYSPQSQSATLAKYIAKTCSVAKIIYAKAGTEYPGAVEDVCNIKGITSVTCEVKTPHGKIASGTVSKSYDMMRAFLNFYAVA